MNLIAVDWPILLMSVFLWAIMLLTALMTPRLTRPDLFFSVTVKPNFRASPEGKEILQRYTMTIIALAVLALIPLVCFLLPRYLVHVGLFGPMVIELVAYFCALQIARQRTMPFHAQPTSEREAVIAPREVSVPGGWLAQSGPFLILAIVAVCLRWNWDRIPARIPIHWGGAGRPDGWAAKSPMSVFSIVIIGGLMLLFLAAIWMALIRGVRRINSSGRAGWREARFLRAMSFFLLGTEYWLALLLGFLGLLAIRSNPNTPLPMVGPLILGQTILIGSVFLIAYRSGQGGWRLDSTSEKEALASDAPPIGDRTPDECWKLGLFYCNPNDPALFVEKRFGVGWTINLSNPRSWLIIGGLLLFMIVTITLSITMTSH